VYEEKKFSGSRSFFQKGAYKIGFPTKNQKNNHAKGIKGKK
jgi:hypothetical protein